MRPVAPLTDSCISCGTAFPPQDALASLDAGRKLACDVGKGRAWLICHRCGNWNLLGAEMSTAVLTELRGRLPGFATDGFAHDQISTLQVLKVSEQRPDKVVSRHGVKSRRLFQFFVRHRRLILVANALLWVGILFGPSVLSPTEMSVDMWLFGGVLLSGFGGAYGIRRWLMGRRHAWAALLGSVLCFATVVAIASVSDTWFTPGVALLLTSLMLGLRVAGDVYLAPWRLRATNGQRYGVNPFFLRNAMIEATATPPGVAIRVRGGAVCFEGDVLVKALAAIDDDLITTVSSEDIEHGWTLLRMHGDVCGVMSALDEARPEDAGRHAWHDLPMGWRMAIQFGVVEAAGTAKERDKLIAQVREASDVAAIAEGLDREIGAGDRQKG